MNTVKIVISYKGQECIPLGVKSKLTKKLDGLELSPADIDWNYGQMNASNLRSTKYTSKIIYTLEGKEDLDLDVEAKSIRDKLGQELASFDSDIKIEGYELS